MGWQEPDGLGQQFEWDALKISGAPVPQGQRWDLLTKVFSFEFQSHGYLITSHQLQQIWWVSWN